MEITDNTVEIVLDRHLQAFGDRNLDAILADYASDAAILMQSGLIEGRQSISDLFLTLFADFAQPGTLFSLNSRLIKGEIAYITWNAETASTIYEFCTDTFVIANGKIAYQTVALKMIKK